MKRPRTSNEEQSAKHAKLGSRLTPVEEVLFMVLLVQDFVAGNSMFQSCSSVELPG